jgi:hypothetical protein
MRRVNETADAPLVKSNSVLGRISSPTTLPHKKNLAFDDTCGQSVIRWSLHQFPLQSFTATQMATCHDVKAAARRAVLSQRMFFLFPRMPLSGRASLTAHQIDSDVGGPRSSTQYHPTKQPAFAESPEVSTSTEHIS